MRVQFSTTICNLFSLPAKAFENFGGQLEPTCQMQVRIRIRGSVGRYIRPRIRATFRAPLAARTAILVRGFAQTRRIRVFPEGWSERTSRFAPEILAARIAQLRELACHIDRPPISHALVVLRYQSDLPLTQDDRDRLWRAFGVPIFEQYLDERNEVLAAECDAHCGLHVVQGCGDLPLDPSPCGCGNPAPRLYQPQPQLKRMAVA